MFQEKGANMEQRAAGIPTADKQVTSAANYILISLTLCSPGGINKWEHLLWGPLPQGVLFLESPNLSGFPLARTFPGQLGAPEMMTVEPARPAAEVLPPVPMQS